MREILYIQAGPLANFAGTHFWNTQEQYLTYSESESFSVEHDVSFREGSDKKGNSIYCPRLLVFDRKSQFGTLARNGVLYGDDDDELPNAWDGSSVELRQEAIPDHPYQTKLLEGESGIGESASITQDVKFWSDFNRVYYHPRSIQMLPDISDWQGAEGDWIHGLNSFTHFAEETDVMETSMRLFLEECDAFQGMQVINDTATFGSFTHSLLSTFHDELSKAPSIVFPLLANVVPRGKHIDEPSSTRKILNDALFLRGQNDLSLTTVPIQSPLSWNEPPWKNILSLTASSYHTSALLSIHIENATIPLRLKQGRETIPLFSAKLNAHGLHRFGQLGGVFPVTPSTEISSETYDYSTGLYCPVPRLFSERRVTRGLAMPSSGEPDRISINNCTSTHVPAPSPLPSSFPDIFADKKTLGYPAANLYSSQSGNTGWFSDTRSAGVFTSLSVTTGLASLFESYARFAQGCVDRRNSTHLRGIVEDWDDLKELVNDLWTIHDAYGAEAEQDDGEVDVNDED